MSRPRVRVRRPGLPALALALALGLVTVAGPALVLTGSATADTPTVFETRVAASSDDAVERPSGNLWLSGTDLELGIDRRAQTVGLRFAGIPLPEGATITASWIQFEAAATDSEAASLTIQGEATDDAITFEKTRDNISSRPTTAASVPWSAPAWTVIHERGLAERTPDLSTVVQEIVDRTGWAPGNAIAFIVTGSGTRTAETYDGSGEASLHVEYTTTAPTTPPPTPTIPPPTTTPPPATNPIVIVFMENRSASEVLGNANAPYLNSFYDGGRAFTNYREGSGAGPSLPDYLQVAAGSSCGAVDDSVVPGQFGSAQGCPTTVWNQLEEIGATWGVYMDAMPSACSSEVTYHNAALDTPYALKHNPATPFASIWSNQALCTAHVLPYTSFLTTSMPAVSFIAPGICNDHHGSPKTQADGTPLYQDCYPDSPELMRRGDDWLAARVPAMLAAGATVFITYDEGGVMYAAEQGPGIPAGVTDSTAYTHYSLLAAIEARFGLAKLGGAQTAAVIPI
jgi:hypothetical protein